LVLRNWGILDEEIGDEGIGNERIDDRGDINRRNLSLTIV